MRIDGRTQLIGLLGWPVAHSLSPAMHNAAAAALGLNWVYVPLPVRPGAVAAAVRGLAALGFLGANVTVPHKQAIMLALDEVSPAARTIGAVNTIVVARDDSGWLLGENTDWVGFRDDLVALGVPVAGRDCLVLGAGGSARGVVYALAQAGGRIHVLARRPEQAAGLLADLRLGPDYTSGTLADLPQVSKAMSAPLIVNTTPLGMSPHSEASIWPADLALPRGAFVYDLIYNPRRTRLLDQAAAAGCESSNGLGMLLRQGMAAFALWSGQTPDMGVMRQALEEAHER